MDMRKAPIVVAAILTVALTVGAVFPETVGLGISYILGTDTSIDAYNNTAGDVNESKHWVQENYSIDNLSAVEFYVTQESGTEPAFANAFYDHDEEGIYVDVVSGEPLFSSKHKFKSGTGWPHFYKPLEPENIVYYKDPGPLGMRIGLRSRHAGSHLGHVFEDAIAQKKTATGRRYCINSAALAFIPEEDLEEEGYGEYVSHFD